MGQVAIPGQARRSAYGHAGYRTGEERVSRQEGLDTTEGRQTVRASRSVAATIVGSGRRLVASAAMLVVVAVAGTLGPLRHASFPGHPYPPSGYVLNPFSTNPDDLLSVADIARVRAAFEQDGQAELDAFARGDAGGLSLADAGARLHTLQQLIAQNNAAGIVQRYENHVESVLVGRRASPDSASIAWHVEEKGTTRLTDAAKATGRVLGTQSYRFNGRFWLAMIGGRYLITDAAVLNEPSPGG